MPHIKGNSDRRYAEWQERADHDPDQDIDWRQAARDRADLDRYAASIPKPTAEQWATLSQNPWANIS